MPVVLLVHQVEGVFVCVAPTGGVSTCHGLLQTGGGAVGSITYVR